MPYVNMKKLITEVAKSRGWAMVPEGITKKIDDRGAGMFGISMKGVESVVSELKVGDSLDELKGGIAEALDRMEGSFVLLSMGYEIYEEDDDGQVGQDS